MFMLAQNSGLITTTYRGTKVYCLSKCLGFWLILLAVTLIVIFLLALLPPSKEGTIYVRRNNPELNTNNQGLHNDRLDKFLKSKYKRNMYNIGSRGGYYYSQYGRKVYL